MGLSLLRNIHLRLRDLRFQVEEEGIKSWTELKALLKTFLWIDALHDKEAKKFYDRVVST